MDVGVFWIRQLRDKYWSSKSSVRGFSHRLHWILTWTAIPLTVIVLLFLLLPLPSSLNCRYERGKQCPEIDYLFNIAIRKSAKQWVRLEQITLNFIGFTEEIDKRQDLVTLLMQRVETEESAIAKTTSLLEVTSAGLCVPVFPVHCQRDCTLAWAVQWYFPWV